nr:hypothetical protein [uncultured Draconibacterium sp.]
MDIKEKIEQNKKELEADGISEPYIDKNYFCETCGSISGECHPVTGMCFICGADDWAPIQYLKKI